MKSSVACGLVILLTGSLIAACASSSRRTPTGANPDRWLFETGTQALNKEKWLTAREYFRELVDGYPQSPFRADAKLGVGDTYLGEGTAEAKVLALNEYREFLTFYPTHARADYAQFKLGMTHFSQMLGPQRDQTETKEAIREFEVFLERYPNSSLAADARTKLRAARDRLSDSNYLVGVFYYRNKWYPGAIDRFKTVLASDPQFTRRDGVYFHLAESLLKLNLRAEALPYYERLVTEFVSSEYLDEAQQRIKELKSGDHASTRTF